MTHLLITIGLFVILPISCFLGIIYLYKTINYKPPSIGGGFRGF